MDKPVGILGAGGNVGKEVAAELKKRDIPIKCGYRRIEKDEKEGCCLDIYDKEALLEFCKGTCAVVGAAGSSTLLSKKMYEAANEAGVPYIDPSGGFLIYDENAVINNRIPCVLGAGLFPGLSGIAIEHVIKRKNEKCVRVELTTGGKYLFTKASSLDFLNESKLKRGAGVMMACIKDSKITPAVRMFPSFIPPKLQSFHLFPYLTEEGMRIASKNKLTDFSSFNAADESTYRILSELPLNPNKLACLYQGQDIEEFCIIIIHVHFEKEEEKVVIKGEKPGKITGIMAAIAAEYVVKNKAKEGIHFFSDLMETEDFFQQFGSRLNLNYEIIE